MMLIALFMLFIFAKVLGSLSYVTESYGHLLLPGIVVTGLIGFRRRALD